MSFTNGALKSWKKRDNEWLTTCQFELLRGLVRKTRWVQVHRIRHFPECWRSNSAECCCYCCLWLEETRLQNRWVWLLHWQQSRSPVHSQAKSEVQLSYIYFRLYLYYSIKRDKKTPGYHRDFSTFQFCLKCAVKETFYGKNLVWFFEHEICQVPTLKKT